MSWAFCKVELVNEILIKLRALSASVGNEEADLPVGSELVTVASLGQGMDNLEPDPTVY